jgi:hypothetical protein
MVLVVSLSTGCGLRRPPSGSALDRCTDGPGEAALLLGTTAPWAVFRFLLFPLQLASVQPQEDEPLASLSFSRTLNSGENFRITDVKLTGLPAEVFVQ